MFCWQNLSKSPALTLSRKYTEYTHLAGTEGDERLVQELYDTWIGQGLDHVSISTYDVCVLFHPRLKGYPLRIERFCMTKEWLYLN